VIVLFVFVISPVYIAEGLITIAGILVAAIAAIVRRQFAKPAILFALSILPLLIWKFGFFTRGL
jgi:hypothetical protein